MKRQLTLFVFLATLAVGGTASAGGIVIVCRDAEQTNGSQQQGSRFASATSTGVTGLTSNFGPRPGLDPSHGMAASQFFLDESDEGEEASYEDVGCGGAQAAKGPTGLLPLLVAGLALLRRRR